MATAKKAAKKAAPKTVKKAAPKKAVKAPAKKAAVKKPTKPRIIKKTSYADVAGWRPYREGDVLSFGCGAVRTTLKDAQDFFEKRPQAAAIDKQIAELQVKRTALNIGYGSGYHNVFSQLQSRGADTIRRVDANLTANRKNLLGY